MTDKEQINDSLKNQNKNFNENFTCENRTVIIDGVDVSECERHCSDNYNTPNMCYSDITRGYRQCNPKENQCDFYITSIEKQLARKTQECEELQEKLDYSHNDNIRWSEAWLKMWRQRSCYRKALEEIEVTIAALHFRTLPFQQGITHELADRVQYYKNIIRDIISKARGKNDN